MKKLLLVGGLMLMSCASVQSPSHADDDAFAMVAGTVKLATGETPSCSDAEVAVVDDQGTRVGKVSVHQGTGRCLFQVSRIPTGKAFTIQASPGNALCSGNKAKASHPLTPMVVGEIRNLDLTAACGS